MPDTLFLFSRAKLQRAEKFIQELEEELSKYRESGPLSARYDFEAKPPVITVAWSGIGVAPGIIAGDALHNMRSSLDLMASELARLNGKSDKNVYFPFSDTEARLQDAIKSKSFDHAGEDAVELLKTFSPYRGGNVLLRALHDLDIQDKHTALVPSGQSIWIELEGSHNIDDPNSVPKLTIRGQEKIVYILSEDSPSGGGNLIEILKSLLVIVSEILDAFTELVHSRRQA